MRLTTRSEYALRALVHLCRHHGEGTLKLREIANRENVDPKYLDNLFLDLKHMGIVASKKGPRGGYVLSKSPDQITLGAVIRRLDGPLAPMGCVSQSAYERCSCPDEESCGLRNIWLDVRNAVADILDRTTLADVCAREKCQHPKNACTAKAKARR